MAINDAWAVQSVDGSELAALDSSGNLDLAGTASAVNVDPLGYEDQTLSGNLTLTVGNATLQRVSPDQARDVILPAEDSAGGKWFRILNIAGSAIDLTVKDDSGATIATIAHNEAANFFCNGTAWKHAGIESIALS